MNARRFRTVFISDVHLGTPGCRAGYLLDFLRSTECEQLYLVGDIIDLEALARRSYWHPDHTAILTEIFRKADAGTRVLYIPGNHDAPMRARAGQTIGRVRVMLDAVHETADGRRFSVSHGDECDPHDYGKRWLYWFGEHAQRLVIFSGRGLNAVRRQLRKPYVPVSIWVKQRIGRALRYIHAYEQRRSPMWRRRAASTVTSCGPHPLRLDPHHRRRDVLQRRRLGRALHGADRGLRRQPCVTAVDRAVHCAGDITGARGRRRNTPRRTLATGCMMLRCAQLCSRT